MGVILLPDNLSNQTKKPNPQEGTMYDKDLLWLDPNNKIYNSHPHTTRRKNQLYEQRYTKGRG